MSIAGGRRRRSASARGAGRRTTTGSLSPRVFRGGNEKKIRLEGARERARRASRRTPARRGPILARSHLPPWSGIPCFPPRRTSGRPGASPPTLRFRFRVEGYGSSSPRCQVDRRSGPRASSKDLLGANRRASCRLRRDWRTSRESGVSPLDAFVLRRGKRPARSEYASSTSLPRAPASVSSAALTQIFSLPPIAFSFMTVCPYDPFSGWRKSARRALIGRGFQFHRSRGGEEKARGLPVPARSNNAIIRRAGGRKRRASRGVGSAGAAFRGARGTVVAVGRSVAEARRRACSRAVVPWSFPRSRASGDPVGARASPPRRRAPSGMSGIPSVAEAQRAYAAYQQYNELDKQYGITDKAVAGTNPRARPPTNPTRPPPPRRPPSASPGPARTETIIERPRVPDEVPPSLPLLRVRSRASPLSPQPNKPPMTSSVVSPPQ